MRRQIPNIISASRILMAVAIVAVSSKLTVLTFTITVSLAVIATFSDFLDGYLARRWNVVSDRGYVIDAMGDRAMHLGLILVMFLRYEFHPVIAWLLLFRDIAIYAVRILTKQWQRRTREARWMSLLHATLVRLWLGAYLVRDGLRLFCEKRNSIDQYIDTAQMFTICVAIAFSYWNLYRSFNWIIDEEHREIISQRKGHIDQPP